jgi:hypothetical protein
LRQDTAISTEFSRSNGSSRTRVHSSATARDAGVISFPAILRPLSFHRPTMGQAKPKAKEIKMKRIVLATALVAASTFGAVAQGVPVMLPSAIEWQIVSLVPTADLSDLTNAQYAQLVTLFSNSENLSAGANPAGTVKAILNAQ